MVQSRPALRWLLAGILVLSTTAFLFSLRGTSASDKHRYVRQVVLHYTLSRLDDPIIILGDSITEASTLPRSICGHALVNAGLDGASTSSDLGNWLFEVVNGRRVAMIIVALGTNDALNSPPASKEVFADRYRDLMVPLSQLTPRLAIAGIPPVRAYGRVTANVAKEALRTIEDYNSVLADVAKRVGATFAPLPEMPEISTIDGVHLNSAGYESWDAAMMQAAASVCDR